MKPFVPKDIDEQIGAGTYRTAYRSPDVPHVSKFGSGEGLANALILQRLARMYPEYFEAEELHAAPKGLPDFLMQDRKTKDRLQWNDTPSMREQDVKNRNAVAFTQRRGVPLETNIDWNNYDTHLNLRNRLHSELPITQAMRMWDVKPQNWGEFDNEGVKVPEYDNKKVKLIDPQFNLRGPVNHLKPYYTKDFMDASKEFQSDLPTLDEFAKPVVDAAYNTGDQRVIAPMEDLMSNEQRQLNESFNWLNP
jgi:hypothetical protein